MRHNLKILYAILGLIFLQFTLYANVAKPTDTQVKIKTKRSTLRHTGIEYYFNIGMAPQLDGSLNLGGDFDMSYYKWLFAGMSFSRSKVTISTKSNTGARVLTLIEAETVTARLLGYKWNVVPKVTQTYYVETDGIKVKKTRRILNDFHFALKPSINAVHYLQTTTLNQIDRSTDSFRYEDSNLRSIQANASLSVWLEWPFMKVFLFGSITPLSQQDQFGLGYDSLEVVTRDDLKNNNYTGGTGDYQYGINSKTFYWAAKSAFQFSNLLFGGDVLLAGDINYLSFDYRSQKNTIFNGNLVQQEIIRKRTKLEVKITTGWEMAFIDLGDAKPFPTFNVTLTQAQDLNGKDVLNIAYGFGITFRK